jgi:glycosyltransferase involved in cell wall biosynthesis
VLATGDAFICASDQQRDMWLGALLASGRVDQRIYDSDPSLRGLIEVVPFGIDSREPEAHGNSIKGVVPGIEPDDKVLLWGGGIWNWFDPLTVIDAVGRIAKERDDVRLYFLGLRHPNPAVPRMEMESRAVAAASELGLRDRVVFFNEGWTPYEERGAYYLDSDLGVSAHFDDLETRFAYRTRLLDCFWAGLPVVATQGDALGDLVREERLGRTVQVEDVDAWTHAITSLLDDPAELAEIRERMQAVRRRLLWSEVVKPLRRLVDATSKLDGQFGPLEMARYGWARGRNAVAEHGAAAAGLTLRAAVGRKRPLEERVRARLR